jgi:hypothetical protein
MYAWNERKRREAKLRIGKMSASSANLAHTRTDLGVSRTITVLKEFLNQLAERAEAAVDRSRFATLPLRYIEDVGLTASERVAILRGEEPAHDPWTLIAIQRL